DPGCLERTVAGLHPHPHEDRAVLREEDQRARSRFGACLRRWFLRGCSRQGHGKDGRCALHPRSPLIGLALGSTSRMGRPLATVFCLVGSRPRPLMTVARRSGTCTGRSLTSSPSAPVLPTAWPPRIPPPASTVVQAFGK